MAGKNAIRALREKGQKKAGYKMKATKKVVPIPKGRKASVRHIEMFRGKEIIPKEFKAREFKKRSPIGLGRTKEGRKPRIPKAPFERGSVRLKPLRKKTRKSSRQSGRK